MTRTPIEVADVLRLAGAEFLQAERGYLSREQLRAVNDLMACRTAELGGHVDACNACGQQRISYNSCRNRHCPKCQATARANWLSARQAELLPVPYFHLVFTLPEALAPLALQNPRVMYGLLFRAASQTLLEVAANPQHLGARIGLLAVLHTWGQNLLHHPHLHCVVPAGGISPDGQRWIRPKNNDYFLPVRVLSRVFRGKFIDLLKRAHAQGKLSFHGRLQEHAAPAAFNELLNVAVRKEWVVYAKRPFGGPEVVLKYLARYTHRVAISNQRLIACDGTHVSFRWKDYAAGSEQKTMRLTAHEFIRRFLLHVLPSGLVRIRHYGWMANRQRGEKLALCRRLLGVIDQGLEEQSEVPANQVPSSPAADLQTKQERCPACQSGRMIRIDLWEPLPRPSIYRLRQLRSRRLPAHIHHNARSRPP